MTKLIAGFEVISHPKTRSWDRNDVQSVTLRRRFGGDATALNPMEARALAAALNEAADQAEAKT